MPNAACARGSAAPTAALAATLGNPRFDPHGDPIPMPSGEVPPFQGTPLTQLAPDQVGAIMHIEDEPEAVFAQIAATGLVPGMRVRVLERSSRRIRLAAETEEVVVAPVVAANITVLPIEAPVDARPMTPLSALGPGEQGEVIALATSCRGAQRRRLLDLGLVPGHGGDPRAPRAQRRSDGLPHPGGAHRPPA